MRCRETGGTLYNSSRLHDTGCLACTAWTVALSFAHVDSSKSAGSFGFAAKQEVLRAIKDSIAASTQFIQVKKG